MNESKIPVLIGVGQFTDRSDSANGLTPTAMMAQAARRAADDSGSKHILKHVDVLAAAGLTVDAEQVKTPVSGLINNVPRAVAKQLGISPMRYVYSESGGDTPQRMVNYFAQEVAQGRSQAVLLTGGEAMHTMRLKFNHWSKLLWPKGGWKDKSGPKPTSFGDERLGSNRHEDKYAMNLPTQVYPLFENALRAHNGREPAEHIRHIAKIFSGFTKVAAKNPYAWLQNERSAEELITTNQQNRMIAYPYPKWLNSMLFVNQSAALIITSVEKAKSLGVSQDRMVYLHGYADGYDIWNVSERANFYSSTVMKTLGSSAMQMAGIDIDDVSVFDIYSCFPSAVQIACDALGLAHDDERGLTLTGGMPYFGGPGNNYNMHAIAEMVAWARSHPSEYGLLNGNGWYLTKHAFGVYSATPPNAEFRVSTSDSMENVSANTRSRVNLKKNMLGAAKIETYTVIYDKSNCPQRAIIVARNDHNRCLATSDNSSKTLDRLLEGEAVGRQGELIKRGRYTEFVF